METRIALRRCTVVFLALAMATSAVADSLFSQRVADGGSLISEKKNRFAVGDIIAVLVRETVSATTDSSTNTKKESEVEAKANIAQNSFLVGQGSAGMNIFNPGELPAWQIEAENEHKGQGSTKRSNKLTTTITCTVMHIMENGNIIISGQKRVMVNREDTALSVSGMVRARDVTPANTVLSTQLADASIMLKGQGPLWNNQRRGLFTKLLDWFSPF